MTIALHHSRATGTAKLVLIGIANHDGDGGAWPSIATLRKYAGVSERSVQYAIKQLENLGEIRRRFQAGGMTTTPDHLRTNLYDVVLRCPPGCDRSSQHNVPASAHVRFDVDASDDAGEVIPGPWADSWENADRGEADCTPWGEADCTPPGEAGCTQTVHTETPKKRPRDRSHDRSRPEPSATDAQKRYVAHMKRTIGGDSWSDNFDDPSSMTFNNADGWIQANMGTYREAGGGQDPRPGLRAGEPF